MTPHYYRQQSIKGCFLILIFIILFLAFGCSPKHGCYSTRGMSGYGWFKCKETKKVAILDKDGSIVCTFIDEGNMLKLNAD